MQKKEPAMRDFKEFERGDWVVFDTSKPYCRLLPPCLMKFIQIEDGDAVVESQGRWSLVSLAALKPASEDDIEAGHRIDKPSNSRELEILDKPENHISPNCKVTETHINEADKLNRLGWRMDKCREEFEKQKYWIGLFRADVDFDMTLGKFGRYVSNGSRRIDAMYLESFNEKWEAWANAWQHQQAKVEELQKQLSEYIFVSETLDEMYVKEVQKSDELQSNVLVRRTAGLEISGSF